MPEWGSYTPASTVPTSAPAAPASSAAPQTSEAGGTGFDPGALLRELISPELIRAASTPITGAHTGAVPSSLQRPITQHQDAPFNTRPVVGAGNARARGIGNAFTGVTNAIGNFVTKQAQNKQDILKDQAVKVIQSQQAIDEAQQQLDMAKQSGDPAAADTIEKMTQMIASQTQTRDSIFAGKHGKDLAKGFDISYTDPQSNKTEYHAAVQSALKDVKTAQQKKEAIQKLQQQMATQRGQNAGAAYAKAQPQGLAPNTTAQAKLGTALQIYKDTTEMLRALSPERVANIRSNADWKKALLEQTTQLQKEQMLITDRTATRQANFAEREKLLGANDANITRRMYTNNALILSREKAMIKFRMNNPDQLFKDSELAASRWDSQQRSAQSRLDLANQNLVNLQAAGHGPGTPEYFRQQTLVTQATEDLATIQDQADYSLKQYNYALTAAGVEPMPDKVGDSDASDDGSGSTGAAGTGNNFTDYFGESGSSSIK